MRARMKFAQLLLLVVGLLALSSAEARRVALIIGNDTYQHAEALKNARADARAVATALQGLGFKVTLKQDVTLEQMKAALRDFKAGIAGGDEVVFYYSGHGVQFGGINYLIPVDLTPESEDQVVDDSVSLQRVLDDMSEQKARFSLAIIDACRDNPFKGNGRAIAKRGLAMQAASGQMILYSAGAGQEALDRLNAKDSDPNGLFTRVLIKEIKKPGVTANQLLKNVSYQVVQMAKGVGHEQVPALYDQTIGDYYFVAGLPVANVPATPTQGAPASQDLVHVQSASELEQEFWNRIKDSTDAADFSDYQKQFPGGAHSAEAALELRKLKRAAQKASAPAVRTADASHADSGGAVTRDVPVANTAPAPAAMPAVQLPASSPLASGSNTVSPGTYNAYSTSTLMPGQVLRGRVVLAANGDFDYTGPNGVKVQGSFDLSRPDDVQGTATVYQPRVLGVPVQHYADGSSTARMVIRAQISGGKLRGRYQDPYETGELIIDLSNSP